MASQNPLVAHLVKMWEYGELSWEQALIQMVRCLCQQNANLMDHLTKQTLEQGPGVVTLPKSELALRGEVAYWKDADADPSPTPDVVAPRRSPP